MALRGTGSRASVETREVTQPELLSDWSSNTIQSSSHSCSESSEAIIMAVAVEEVQKENFRGTEGGIVVMGGVHVLARLSVSLFCIRYEL